MKRILVTGATDGIGLETSKKLVELGHQVLLHGRNPEKLEKVANSLSSASDSVIESYVADLSRVEDVEKFANEVSEKHDRLDVLINNAGIFKTSEAITEDGLDVRFVVNTIAPYLLTTRLLPLLDNSSRVVNLSSAAQSPVSPEALLGKVQLQDMEAYAQSKLALTMWSRHLALSLPGGPVVVAVNPGSLLGSKMVKEAFGVAGGEIGIGADILVRSALSDEFEGASGKYYDNDKGKFSSPHSDAMDNEKNENIVNLIKGLL